MADWSGLHEDLLHLLVARLPVLDLLLFRAVCASWRAVALAFVLGGGHPRPDRPWLILPTASPTDNPDHRRLLVCSDHEVPVVTLPARLGRDNGHRRRFVPLGSSRGMVVAADDLGAMHLLDLVTGSRAPLPPVATLPLVGRGGASLDGLREGLLHKAVPVPTRDGGILVVVIYRLQQQRNQWATARPSDHAWKSVAPTSIPAVFDVIVHRGQLYANTRYGLTYVFPELRGLGSASPEIIPSMTRLPRSYVELSYLVESPAGDLMQIECLRPVAPRGDAGLEFVVRVLDECSEAWEETEDVGDVAVFVDAAGAVTASSRDRPGLRANCVYFAKEADGETRVCVYSLGGKDKKKVEVVGVVGNADGYKPPCFWFTPVYTQG